MIAVLVKLGGLGWGKICRLGGFGIFSDKNVFNLPDSGIFLI